MVHKSKKRKGKKVELIDDLENKYEAKIARSHEEAETVISDVGAKKPKKRKKNQLQRIDGESHVEEKKKSKLHTKTGKHIGKFLVRKIEEETVKTSVSYTKKLDKKRTCHDM